MLDAGVGPERHLDRGEPVVSGLHRRLTDAAPIDRGPGDVHPRDRVAERVGHLHHQRVRQRPSDPSRLAVAGDGHQLVRIGGQGGELDRGGQGAAPRGAAHAHFGAPRTHLGTEEDLKGSPAVGVSHRGIGRHRSGHPAREREGHRDPGHRPALGVGHPRDHRLGQRAADAAGLGVALNDRDGGRLAFGGEHEIASATTEQETHRGEEAKGDSNGRHRARRIG